MNQNTLLLYELCRQLKNKDDKLLISSTEYGDILGVSQQSAARHLSDLAKSGLIKRVKTSGGQEVSLTDKGYSALREIYLNLGQFFSEKKNGDAIEGLVVRGIGEGAYYVKEYSEEISRKLGFEPFLGTLNVKATGELVRDADFQRHFSGTIKGFRRGGRTFGDIRYAHVRLHSGAKSEECILIQPARTIHKDVLELISPHNLRERLGISEDQGVSVEFI